MTKRKVQDEEDDKKRETQVTVQVTHQQTHLHEKFLFYGQPIVVYISICLFTFSSFAASMTVRIYAINRNVKTNTENMHIEY